MIKPAVQNNSSTLLVHRRSAVVFEMQRIEKSLKTTDLKYGRFCMHAWIQYYVGPRVIRTYKIDLAPILSCAPLP